MLQQLSFSRFFRWGVAMSLAWTVFGLFTIAALFQTQGGENLAGSIFSQPRPFVLHLVKYWAISGVIAGWWSLLVWNNMQAQYREGDIKTAHAGCMSFLVMIFGGALTTQYYATLPLPEGISLQAWYWRLLLGALGLAWITTITLRMLYARAGSAAETRPSYIRCPTCGGSGWYSEGAAYFGTEGPCPMCKGMGIVEPGAAMMPADWLLPRQAQPSGWTTQYPEQENYAGVLEAQAGNFEQAEAIFSKLCDRYPGWASPRLNLANVLVEMKHFRPAEALLREAWELSDSETELVNIMVGLGNVYFHQRCYTRALFYFEQALQRGDEASDVRFNMGFCHYYLGHIREAAGNFNHVHSIRNPQKLAHVRSDLKQFDYADPEARILIDVLRASPMRIFTHPNED
ncbi:MAG TPA: hypothetical protein PLW66_09455, partial [Saprospiraceae bacterium]|nr:hypothetical protein [Saprospiraceae bacterium]